MPREIIYSKGKKSIEIDLTELGIVATHVFDNPQIHGAGNLIKNGFILGERRLEFQERDEQELKRAIVAMRHNTLPTAPKTTVLISQVIGADLRQTILLPYFRNMRRREEIFYPVLVNQEKKIGAYIYPWLSSPTNVLEGKRQVFFNKFVTAGCLFGSSLQGMDERGMSFPLIKHDLDLYKNQKITSIVNTDNSLYEELQFNQLATILEFIDRSSSPEKQKKLDYHLPYFDYVLYGIKLFIHNQITPDALRLLFELIHERKNKHTEKIKMICSEHGIDVTIASPFDGIFSLKGDTEQDFVNAIYEAFPFLLEESVIPVFASEKEEKEFFIGKEKEFVELCFHKLCNGNSSPVSCQLWKEEFNVQLDGVEDLFEIANPIMLAIAANGADDCEVCSILPTSEKQIQLGYQDIISKAIACPVVLNLTLLDMFPAYSASNQYSGLTFYSSDPDLPKCFSFIVTALSYAQAKIAELATLKTLEELTQSSMSLASKKTVIHSTRLSISSKDRRDSSASASSDSSASSASALSLSSTSSQHSNLSDSSTSPEVGAAPPPGTLGLIPLTFSFTH